MIRVARAPDFPGLAKLVDEVDALHRIAMPWLFREGADPRHEQALAEFSSQEDHAILVAETDGTLAGAIWVYLRAPSRHVIVQPTTVAEIDMLVVASTSRRQGIGSQLVLAALAWAEERGATRTELGAYELNQTALAFWEAVGFKTLSRRFVRHARGA
jgi:ribosomal protein S18 acetylase RimI-like enzyme